MDDWMIRAMMFAGVLVLVMYVVISELHIRRYSKKYRKDDD